MIVSLIAIFHITLATLVDKSGNIFLFDRMRTKWGGQLSFLDMRLLPKKAAEYGPSSHDRKFHAED